MRPVPTLFRRDPADRRFVTADVAPGCEWVPAGEGVGHRLLVGATYLFDPAASPGFVSPVPELQGWWGRVKTRGSLAPHGEGWTVAPAGDRTIAYVSAHRSAHAAVLARAVIDLGRHVRPGTYVLIGPRLNRNPERVPGHVLVAHADTEVVDAPRDHDGLREWLQRQSFSGVVWHHRDGRMAKIKRRDLRG